MKLIKVDITNFRCFESLSVPLHPKVNVFVGVNGAGKTSLLDAIAVALYDIVAAQGGSGKERKSHGTELRPGDIYIPAGTKGPVTGRRDFVLIKAQAGDFYPVPDFPANTPSGEPRILDWEDHVQYRPPNTFVYEASHSNRLKDVYRYFQSLWREIRTSDERALIPCPVVAYYRAQRRLSQVPDLGNIFSAKIDRETALRHALDAGRDYKQMVQWFFLRENQELRERLQIKNDRLFELPDLKAVRAAVVRVVENVEQIFFEDSPPRLKVRRRTSEQETEILDVEQFSDGYRNLLALVLDFARRLAQAHPNWDNPLEAPGILLIDEVELHLHPQWQQRIIPNLTSVFPNTQLILATHSPQVLTTVTRENIAILRDNQLYAPQISTYGAESNRVMGEVMQTDNRPPDNRLVHLLRELFEHITYGRFDEALNLHEDLARQWGPDEPALIEAVTTIKNRQWEKELGL